MNDKYRSEGFEGDLPTPPGLKNTASRMVSLPRWLCMVLVVFLACVSILSSKTVAEDRTRLNPSIEQTDKTARATQAALALGRAAMVAHIDHLEPWVPATAKSLQRLMDGFQFGRVSNFLSEVDGINS